MYFIHGGHASPNVMCQCVTQGYFFDKPYARIMQATHLSSTMQRGIPSSSMNMYRYVFTKASTQERQADRRTAWRGRQRRLRGSESPGILL